MPAVEETKTFFRVRIKPARKKCKTPAYARRIAQTVSKGSRVVTCRNQYGWYVQSVLIRKGHGKGKRDAQRLARRIVNKIGG